MITAPSTLKGPPMRTTLLACLTATTLTITACGGSDDSTTDDSATDDSASDAGASDGGVNSDAEGEPAEVGVEQQRVVDLLLSGAGDSGIELDEVCINENIGRLSDDDAKALADAGVGGEADISDEAAAIGETVFSECVDAASYADAQVDAIGQIDETIDLECFRDALDGLTVDEIDEQIFDAATDCADDS